MRRLLAVLALFLTVPGALPSNPAAAETIQLKKHAGGGYPIPGRINDAVTVTFVLDTGASDVSIPDEVARELERPASSSAATLSARAPMSWRTARKCRAGVSCCAK